MEKKLLTPKDMSKAMLSYEAKTKKIKRLARGVYSVDQFYDWVEVYSLRYPYAIFTLETMFSLYDMTDQFVDKYWIVTPRGSRTIKDDKIAQIRQIKGTFEIGKAVFYYGEININSYNLERLLIELFRFSSRIPKSVYKDVVSYYRKAVYQNFDINKYHEYCSFFKEKNWLEDKLEKEIL